MARSLAWQGAPSPESRFTQQKDMFLRTPDCSWGLQPIFPSYAGHVGQCRLLGELLRRPTLQIQLERGPCACTSEITNHIFGRKWCGKKHGCQQADLWHRHEAWPIYQWLAYKKIWPKWCTRISKALAWYHQGYKNERWNLQADPLLDMLWLFPQQRKLMGSSAQNTSGVHWCRRRVSFNELPEKVPGGFGAEPGQVQQDLRPFNSRKPGWGVSSAWLRSTLQKDL